MAVIEFIEEVSTKNSNWSGIKQWVIESVLNEAKNVGVVTFVFMSDESLLKYNQDYLNHDYFTDVITFDDCEFPVVNGDILISVDRIIDNSNKLITSYKEEFLRVIIHGILHLCGYKDKIDFDIIQMREKERFYLDRVDFEL